MASPTNRKQPRPWHTVSFFKARASMLCIGVLVCALDDVSPFLPGLLFGIAFLDVVAVVSKRRNGFTLPKATTIDDVQGDGDKLILGQTILAFVLCFLAVLIAGSDLLQPRSGHSFLIRSIVVLVTNIAGWSLLAWLREAFVVMRHYNIIAGTAEVSFAGAPQPILSGVPTHTQPTQQAQALPLRVGNGASP